MIGSSKSKRGKAVTMEKQIALVTGAGKKGNTGYETARQLGELGCRVIIASSGAGSYEDPKYGLKHGTFNTEPMGYGISKLALNGVTVKAAHDLAANGILVNSVCPDVTDTWGMGFGRSAEESAKSVVWGATLPDDGPTGGFFRDGEPLPW